jgi:hypothetical protein
MANELVPRRSWPDGPKGDQQWRFGDDAKGRAVKAPGRIMVGF